MEPRAQSHRGLAAHEVAAAKRRAPGVGVQTRLSVQLRFPRPGRPHGPPLALSEIRPVVVAHADDIDLRIRTPVLPDLESGADPLARVDAWKGLATQAFETGSEPRIERRRNPLAERAPDTRAAYGAHVGKHESKPEAKQRIVDAEAHLLRIPAPALQRIPPPQVAEIHELLEVVVQVSSRQFGGGRDSRHVAMAGRDGEENGMGRARFRATPREGETWARETAVQTRRGDAGGC